MSTGEKGKRRWKGDGTPTEKYCKLQIFNFQSPPPPASPPFSFLVIAGLVAVCTLPIAQYPEVSPPTVLVTASYPPRKAARKAMYDVTGPVVAVALVLCAAFVPCGRVQAYAFSHKAQSLPLSPLERPLRIRRIRLRSGSSRRARSAGPV
jgi:hypothetical protein